MSPASRRKRQTSRRHAGGAEGLAKAERIVLTPGHAARRERPPLHGTQDERIDAVAIGSPHLSLDEVNALEALLARPAARRAVLRLHRPARHPRASSANGKRAALERQGVTFVADTCVVVTPILPELTKGGVLMTNSGKFAHYAPGNTGYAVQYGSLADCVESAVTGRLVREDALWLTSSASRAGVRLKDEVLILLPGTGEGEALALTHADQLLGRRRSARPATSSTRAIRSAANASPAGAALPGTIGSSSASAVLLELVHAGKAPAAILMTSRTPSCCWASSSRGRWAGQRPPRCACRWSASGRWRDAI